MGSSDVNEYLKAITGQDYTSKDFRTWAGTVLAAELLRQCEPCTSETDGKRNILRAVESVAHRLGNTKAVSRKCYIHPAIFDSYLDGSLLKPSAHTGEAAVLALLQRRAAREQRKKAS